MKKHAKAWAIALGKYGIGFGLLAYVISSNWKPNGVAPAEGPWYLRAVDGLGETLAEGRLLVSPS